MDFQAMQGYRKLEMVQKNRIFSPKLSDKMRTILQHFARYEPGAKKADIQVLVFALVCGTKLA